MNLKLAAVSVAGAILGCVLWQSAAEASPKVYGHCMDQPAGSVKACVDTTGWGIRLRFEDGSFSDNYGPEAFKARMVNGKLFYTIHGETYGPAIFPTFDY